jgi:hypothetical protein
MSWVTVDDGTIHIWRVANGRPPRRRAGEEWVAWEMRLCFHDAMTRAVLSRCCAMTGALAVAFMGLVVGCSQKSEQAPTGTITPSTTEKIITFSTTSKPPKPTHNCGGPSNYLCD